MPEIKASKFLCCALQKYDLHYSSVLKALFTLGDFKVYNTAIYQMSSQCHKLHSLGLCSIIHSAALTVPTTFKLAEHLS